VRHFSPETSQKNNRSLQFSDGTPFSCDDVVFTMQRLLDPEQLGKPPSGQQPGLRSKGDTAA